jgi:hypothetical protein
MVVKNHLHSSSDVHSGRVRHSTLILQFKNSMRFLPAEIYNFKHFVQVGGLVECSTRVEILGYCYKNFYKLSSSQYPSSFV